MLNTNFAQSFLPWEKMGRGGAYSAMINLRDDAAYKQSLEFSKSWPAHKSEQPNLARYYSPHTESSAIMTSDWGARKYFCAEWEGGTYRRTLNDHTLWYVNKWVDQGGLQSLYHDQFAPHTVGSVSSGLAYVLPDGRVQQGYALTTRRRYVMRQHALWLAKGINPPRTLTHTTNGGPMGSYGWIESCVDGEDKQLTRDTPLDFADMWTSERIRAGSLSYNLGATYSWMRLIDTRDMPPGQIEAHKRTYAGHCLMHDVMNAWVWSYAWSNDPKSALMAWDMNDDRVFFWPFWNNADMVRLEHKDLRVSAWTLPDRILLCAMNYSKAGTTEAEVIVDLARMGVTLPVGATAWDAEKPEKAVEHRLDGAARVRVRVGPRDFRLIAIGAGK